jgi:Zn-dependent protease
MGVRVAKEALLHKPERIKVCYEVDRVPSGTLFRYYTFALYKKINDSLQKVIKWGNKLTVEVLHKMNNPNSHSNQSQQKNKNNKSRWLMWGAAIAVLFPKLKGILSILKLGKFGGTIISMFVTVGAYAILFPWQFAVGLVVMIFIHEIGHVWAAKMRGLPVSAPTFIPFLGALITMKRHPRDAVTEAYVAFGGPLIGTLGAVLTFWIGTLMNSPLLNSVAMIGIFLNLINLLPIHPLDGGRIVTAISRWFWLLGLVGGLAVIVYLQSVLFFIIWVMFAFDLYGKYGPRKKRKRAKLPVRLTIPFHTFEQANMMIPGEAHRRRLPFSTYCDSKEGKQMMRIHWPGLEGLDPIVIPAPSIIKEVEVEGLRKNPPEDPTDLIAQIQVTLEPYENDRYYDVPINIRWTYGLAYLSLALFLIYMYFFVIPPYLPNV